MLRLKKSMAVLMAPLMRYLWQGIEKMEADGLCSHFSEEDMVATLKVTD